MSHLIDSFGYSKNIESNVWWLGANDVDANRVVCWGDDVSAEVAYRKALLDGAEPVVTPLFYGTTGNAVSQREYRAYERRDGRGLIGIVGPKHRYLSNEALLSLIPWPVQAAGSLENGRRVFAQAKVPGIDLSVNRSNGRKLEVAPYMLFYNSHDGTSRARVRFTSTVTVCHNTVTAALSEAGVAEWSMKHTAQILDRERIERELAEMYEAAVASYEEQRQTLQAFASARFSRNDARAFFAALLTESESFDEARPKLRAIAEAKQAAAAQGKSDRSATIFEEKGAELVRLFVEGLGQRADDDKSKLDALQAVTEYVDHQRSRSAAWRAKAANFSAGLNNSLFGDGHETKQRAVRLLAKW